MAIPTISIAGSFLQPRPGSAMRGRARSPAAHTTPVAGHSQRYSSNLLPSCDVGDWAFLTNHARALLFIARDPDARLRDLATALDVTERTAYGIVADLTGAGYVVKEKGGRRNRYHIQAQRPLGDPLSRERTIGELLDLLVETELPRRAKSRRA